MLLLLPVRLLIQSAPYEHFVRTQGVTTANARDAHLALAVDAISAVWRRRFPRYFGCIHVFVDRPATQTEIGGDFDADPFGAYSAELRSIRLNPGRTSMLRRYLGEIFSFEECLAMVSAHEAMHAVQDAEGDPAPPTRLPDGTTNPKYATCRHEVAARVAAWEYFCSRWPERRAVVLKALNHVDLAQSRVPEVITPMLQHPDPQRFYPRGRRTLSWRVLDKELVVQRGLWRDVRDQAEDWLWAPLMNSRRLEPRYPLR